jgi:Skp family chaperone for outer membrane proteins
VIHFQYHAMRTALAFVLPLGLAAIPLTGRAQSQSNPGWFVPEQPKSGGGAAGPARQSQTPPARPRGATVEPSRTNTGTAGMPPESEGLVPNFEPQGPLPPLQAQLPPPPEIPSIPKSSPTPAAIVGILSVQDVLRISTAYQQGEKELNARRQRLSEDAQKEQNALRELGQSFANERAKLTPEQIRAREKEYADRVNDSRRKFSERARIIQEAGQYIMAQIERVVERVSQDVAASRGINLVLNRAQILGTTADFDLTPQVADILNKVLPAVLIPPDGVSPTKLSATSAGPRASNTLGNPPGAAPAKKN